MRSGTIGKHSSKLTVKVVFYIMKSQRATSPLGYGKIQGNHHNTTFKSSQTTFVANVAKNKKFTNADQVEPRFSSSNFKNNWISIKLVGLWIWHLDSTLHFEGFMLSLTNLIFKLYEIKNRGSTWSALVNKTLRVGRCVCKDCCMFNIRFHLRLLIVNFKLMIKKKVIIWLSKEKIVACMIELADQKHESHY